MGKASIVKSRIGIFLVLLAGLLVMGPAVSVAADTVCARVKIEIKQELTLERQAFDAHMRINNGLSNIRLENVTVDVSFADKDGNPVLASSDPDNTDAMFFIRLDSMDNIDISNGPGIVAASTSADIHWLIIPAPGSSNGLESGTLYYVGAKLSYKIGGEPKVTEVTPDYIFVKPMPEITLDYFLPSDVYGDDPLTDDTVEPVVPFSLGVRVKNSGQGVARNLKIESAQPKITENKQDLLIGFAIEGSEVNGQPASDSLLVDFGNIAPASAGLARWIMTCTLSGKFVSFTADFSHSDELGGELTSLIQAVNTHFLVRDVLVDLPGRDAVRDFLAKDGGVYRIYESEVNGLADPADQDPVVLDQSAAASLTGTGDTARTLTTNVTAGFMYVRVDDPFDGQQVLKEVIRSDGKVIKPDNAWLSHTRFSDNPWQYHINLFDVNSPGSYTLKFESAAAVPLPPVLQFIADKTVEEDTPVSFIVQASDPNNTVPQLSAAPLPVGATFVDQGAGVGIFAWTPAEGQAGVYQITYRASDGLLAATRRATITVKGFTDTDGDNLDDDWELQHFGALDRNGSGDFDHDGTSDLEEFENGTDPAELADLAIYQQVDKRNPLVGDEVTLTITATNNGSRDVGGVEILDLLPGGLTYKNDDSGGSYDSGSGVWDIGSFTALAPGQTVTLEIYAEVTRAGKVLNIATLTGADLYDPDRSNNSAALLLNGAGQSDLALALAGDKLTPEAGETIAVTLTVTNNGLDDAAGVEIEALLPGNLPYAGGTASLGSYDQSSGIWVVGELASGAGAELQLMLTAGNIDESILTAALIAGDQADPDPTNNRSSIVINQNPGDHLYIADLAIHKLVNLSEVEVGGPAVFTLLVRNNGPDDAGNIEIDDLLSVGLELQSVSPFQGSYDGNSELWRLPTLPAGALAMMDVTVAVTEAGRQDNTAVILVPDEPSEFDPDGGNDTDISSVTGLAADIGVTQTADKTTANPGEYFEFTVTVANHGPHDATGVVVVDEVPAGLAYQSDAPSRGEFDAATGLWEVGDLAQGDTATLIVTYRVETAGPMVHKAGLQASSPTDTDTTNDEAQVTVAGNAAPVVAEIPDLTIEEGIDSASVSLDELVTDDNNAAAELTWSFSNPGPLTVWIDDERIAHIEVHDLDWNGSQSITFTATDPFGLSDESQLLFTVTAVNDAPVNTVPGDQATAEDTGLTIAPAISIADIDADSSPLQVTLSATHGTLSLAETNGLLFSAGNGIADTVLTFSGTIAAINTALDGLRFDPEADYFGSALITIQTDDLGSSGSGGSQADTDTVNVTVSAVNDVPSAALDPAFSGSEGQSITFAGSAADVESASLTFFWDFDYRGDFVADASGSDLSAPEWTYGDNGTYTVALRVKDAEDAESEIAVAEVTVSDRAPLAAFTWSPESQEEGSPVAFSDGSTSAPDAIAAWHWDFGNGQTSEDQNPAYTFFDNGMYTVRLTVTDDDGSTDYVEHQVTINDRAPTAAFTWLPATQAEGSAVAFSDASTSAPDAIAAWHWDFGNGQTSEDQNPAYTYLDNGSYTVRLTVTDDDGSTDYVEHQVTIVNVAPEVEAGADQTVAEGADVNFSGSFSDASPLDTHTYAWNFGDGSPVVSGSLTPTHSYADDGVYEVTLTVTDDDGGEGVGTMTVTVNNVAPMTETGSDAAIDEGGTFTGSGSFADPGADTWTATVDYGDGSGVKALALDSEKNFALSHLYTENGAYTVTVAISDGDGGWGTDTATVTVNNVAPSVAAGPDATIDEGATFTRSGTFADPGTDEWTATVDYGDGSDEQSLALNPDKSFLLNHIYAENSAYTVTIAISDDDGGSGSDTIIVSVNNVAPAADAGDGQAVTEGDLVSFSGGFTDPGADTHTIEWDFGDGATAADTLTPVHSYGDNGTYKVTLTVTDDDGGAGVSTLTVKVTNATPVVTGLTGDNPSTGEVHLTVAFADPGWLDTHSSHWVFENDAEAEISGAEKTEDLAATGTMSAVYNYAAEGLYEISVTVTDDDGAESAESTMNVLIDKTAPSIEVFEPQAGYYRNTDEIMVDVAIADPVSGGVTSRLVDASVAVTLDGWPIAADELLDLSELTDGVHTLYVSASDYAGNLAEAEVRFEVGPVPALVHITPHNWSLEWLDPFADYDDSDSKSTIKAEISLENAEVETIIPTDNAARLKIGDGYGDFVVKDVVADQTSGDDKGNVVALTLEYVGVDEMDILVFSGDTVQDFYSVNAGDSIAIVSGQAGYLDRHTVLSSYQSDPPLLSAADIIPESILLNQWVPIIAGSAQLITKDAAALAQSGVIAEPPYGIVKEKKHHLWLANVGQPREMTLEVGSQTIFADEPYPVDWQDWFSLDEDGRLQMMRIHVSEKDNLLQVLHHNLQAEARIYLDGNLALTILPETNLVAMEVLFNRFDVMSSIDKELLQRGGDWLVTAYNGATLAGKDPRKHIAVADIGYPQNARLVIGDTVVFDDQPFPLNWSERYLIIDGQRQDLSIKTQGANGNDPHLKINCKQLTQEARLYLDDALVLLISPPPEVGVSLTGQLELDGDPATFDGSFRGSDAIELKGKLPKDFDPPMSYQRIDTSGEPALQIGSRNGDFEVVSFTAEYKDYRVTDLSFSYDGASGTEINVYEDSHRKQLIDHYAVSPWDDFVLDVSFLHSNKVYLDIENKIEAIDLDGRKAAEIGDRLLNCTITDISWIPIGPPHYIDLTLEYTGAIDGIALTAYDGKRKDVVGTYQVDSDINPAFTIDGSQLRKGHLGDNLVLEFGLVEPPQ